MVDEYCSRVSYDTGRVAVFLRELTKVLQESGLDEWAVKCIAMEKLMTEIALVTFEETPPVGTRITSEYPTTRKIVT